MSQPHYSLWRRFRWRYRTSFLMLFTTGLLPLPSALCPLLWLLPKWHYSAALQVCRWFWFALWIGVSCVGAFVIVLYLFTALLRSPSYSWLRGKGVQGFFLITTIVAVPLTLAALAIGRIDWATELFYGSVALNSIGTTYAEKTWRHLPSLAANSLVFAAMPLHSVKFAVAGLAFSYTNGFFKRRDWANAIRQKPIISVYAQGMQNGSEKNLFKQIGSNPLKMFHDLKMRDEARQEFERLKQTKTFSEKEKIIWEIRLAAGEGRTGEALEIAEQNTQDTSKDFLLLLALLYAQENNREAALKTLSKITPRWSEAARIGEIYAAMGDYEAALVHYERASRTEKKHQLLRNMANTLMALGQYKDAAYVFRDAIAAAPYLATGELKNLALCYRQLGNEQAAVQTEKLGGLS